MPVILVSGESNSRYLWRFDVQLPSFYISCHQSYKDLVEIAAIRKQLILVSAALEIPLDKDFQALEDLVESEKKESKEKNRKRVTSSQG